MSRNPIKPMKKFVGLVACLLMLATNLPTLDLHADEPSNAADSSALKVLLVAGGCCHDYPAQTKLLKEGIEQRINAVVTVILNEDTTTKAAFEIYENDDWADGYDVVIHDECSADVTQQPYVDRILSAHRNGTPAVNLHCAMHSYRWGDFREPVEIGDDNAGWYEMIGVQSTGHGAKAPLDVEYSDSDHPTTVGMENWTTIDEELYNNVRVFDGTDPLITGKQLTPPNKRELKKNPDAQPKHSAAVIAWTNEYGPDKTRIFSTSLGHQNETVGDARYLDLVCRGLLWVTGNITADGTPAEGYSPLETGVHTSLAVEYAQDKNVMKLIFEDDFNRDETQEEKEEIGNGWTSNSDSRANGNKQVDLKDGAMHIAFHPSADHAVSVRHDAEFENGKVQLRFMLENPKDKLGLDFADMKLKSVHAGHLFKVTVGTSQFDIVDMKTGIMSEEIRKQKTGKKLPPEIQELLKTKKKVFKHKTKAAEWHDLVIEMMDEKITVTIDGEQAGSFESEGFAHPTKRMLRLSVPAKAVVDDLKIFSAVAP